MKGPEPDEGIWNNIFISEILSKFTSNNTKTLTVHRSRPQSR